MGCVNSRKMLYWPLQYDAKAINSLTALNVMPLAGPSFLRR
jgi:hypothetical protein